MIEDAPFPYVGRVAEIGRCRRLLRKAPAAEAGLNILVTGDRGVGKTRFMQEVMNQAKGLGFKHFFHHCQKWDRYRPFTTIASVIRLLLGRPPAWTPRNLETVSKTVSEFSPDLHLDTLEAELLYWLLGATAVSEHIQNLDDRSRKGMVSRLVGNLLRSQLRRQPFLLLAIDDLHYSDSFSSNFLVSSVMGKGVVLLASAASSVSLRFRREVEEIPIKPFDKEEMKTLLVKRFGVDFPSETFIPELLRSTGGNALYLVQLLTPIPTGEEAASELARMLEDSRLFRTFEIVLARLRKLDARSLELIQIASVIEDRFPLPILKRMTEPQFPLKAPLKQLSSHKLGWVEKHKGTDFFRFQHGIVREAAYSLLGDHRRQSLHSKCAEVVKRYYRKSPDKRLMTIAYHHDKAGERQKAAEAYLEAGRHFYRLGDLPLAEEAYRLSERLHDDREEKLRAMASLIRVLDHESKVDESFEVAQRFFDSDPPPRMQAEVLGSMARLHGVTGSLVKAAEYGERAVKLAEECGAESELASACIALAPVFAYMGRISDALSYGGRGYGLAEKLGDRGQTAAALNSLAIVNAIDGSLQEARNLFERVSEIWQQMDHLHYAATGQINVAIAMTEMGEFEEAVKRFTQAIDLFEKMGAVENCALAKHYAAAALMETGEYRKGFATLESAISLFATVGRSPEASGASHLLKASYLLKMGKLEEAIPELDKGWSILSQEGRWRDKAWVVDVRLEAAILQGDVEPSLKETEEFLEEARRGEVKAIYQSALLTRLRAVLEAGQLDKAEEVSEFLDKLGFSGQNPRNEALAKALLSHLAADKGDFTTARKLLDEAVGSGRLSTECRGHANLWLAEGLLSAGKSTEATEHLNTAREIYTDLVREGYRRRELDMIEEMMV